MSAKRTPLPPTPQAPDALFRFMAEDPARSPAFNYDEILEKGREAIDQDNKPRTDNTVGQMQADIAGAFAEPEDEGEVESDVEAEAEVEAAPIAEVQPGFLSVVDPRPAEIIPPAGLASTGRRTALANWLARPDNPLTSRVIVNRVWQYHFGKGIAASTSDLGRTGELPTHPELLDWLASEFVAPAEPGQRVRERVRTDNACN